MVGQVVAGKDDEVIRLSDERCRLILFVERLDSDQCDAHSHLLGLHDALAQILIASQQKCCADRSILRKTHQVADDQ